MTVGKWRHLTHSQHCQWAENSAVRGTHGIMPDDEPDFEAEVSRFGVGNPATLCC